MFQVKGPCPKCPSSDAFATYDDGHGYCYSCKYYQPSDQIKQLEYLAQKHMSSIKEEVPGSPVISLPDDASKTIDIKALTWLGKYDITRSEIIQYDLLWSKSREWLIFPIRGANHELIAYTARTFSPYDPKWMTMGNVRSCLHLVGLTQKQKDVIILVEDIVSAIKVGRVAAAMPIFGSHIGPDLLVRLKYITKKIIFWLDEDKYMESLSGAKRAEMIGLEAHVLYSEHDPKAYSNDAILNRVNI